MSLEIYRPYILEKACALLAEKDGALPMAGGTDLLSRRERGIELPPVLICLDGLGLDTMRAEPSGGFTVGSLVTHASVAGSPFLAHWAPVLAEACAAVGSPQVRNVGTLGGNICNASPAADAVSALMVMEAILEITGPGGMRCLPIEEFFLGPGRTALQRGEILSDIILPAPAHRSAYLKLGLRRALEIAVVGVAVNLEMEGKLIKKCRIGLASVAPTPLRAHQAEATLIGRELTSQSVEDAARAAASECSPISDHRASGEYRRVMIELFVQRAINAAAERQNQGRTVPAPRSSAGRVAGNSWPVDGGGGPKLSTRLNLQVNDETYSLEAAPDKLLGDVLRENLGLTGVKMGCGEGECGACSVLLDGISVNSCLILVSTVGNRKITTVEGLAKKGTLHPLQAAFIQEGAVQCGYCTPGMLMSAAALLNSNPRADEEEIKTALSGNLCRCTGYKKIIRAVQAAEGAGVGHNQAGSGLNKVHPPQQ